MPEISVSVLLLLLLLLLSEEIGSGGGHFLGKDQVLVRENL